MYNLRTVKPRTYNLFRPGIQILVLAHSIITTLVRLLFLLTRYSIFVFQILIYYIILILNSNKLFFWIATSQKFESLLIDCSQLLFSALLISLAREPKTTKWRDMPHITAKRLIYQQFHTMELKNHSYISKIWITFDWLFATFLVFCAFDFAGARTENAQMKKYTAYNCASDFAGARIETLKWRDMPQIINSRKTLDISTISYHGVEKS
jgi:hypothetical protein